MELGQRLKQARLEAGLSQRQLCSDLITRNMLSQIENGTARPSMSTLSTLASRLGKPVSYFLEEATVSPNQGRILSARSAYAAQDYPAALVILEDFAPNDPVFDSERYLLEALCCLGIGDEPHLQQAAEAGRKTPYFTPELERRRLLLLGSSQLSPDPRELLLHGDTAMASGDLETALKWYTLAEPLSPREAWPRLEECYRRQEDYKMAYHYACKLR